MDKFKNAKSKLSTLSKDQINLDGLVNKKKTISKIKSFRLSDDDIKDLESIRESVNQVSKTYISDSKIIRALICLGVKTNAKDIVKSLKELI